MHSWLTVISSDEEGMELPDIEAVQEEAARSLADVAKKMPFGTEVGMSLGTGWQSRSGTKPAPFSKPNSLSRLIGTASKATSVGSHFTAAFLISRSGRLLARRLFWNL